MPVFTNFDLAKFSDGVLTIALTPQANVAGWSVEFTLAKCFGASSSGVIARRSAASGYGGGQSGITVTDSGQGVFQIVAPTPEEMSGRDAGPYAFEFSCLNSGSRGPLTLGYCLYGDSLRQ